ncbi:hypothetical protein ACSBR1_008596 [Camellia fascicularis]
MGDRRRLYLISFVPVNRTQNRTEGPSLSHTPIPQLEVLRFGGTLETSSTCKCTLFICWFLASETES